MTEPIFVTGATGNVGGEVARYLLEAGARVRVGVRDPSSDKAAEWLNAGAELARFDYDEPSTLRSVLEGVERLFLMTPYTEDPMDLNWQAMASAKEMGLSFVLKLSAMGADPSSTLPVGNLYGRIEEAIKTFGVDWAFLQPTYFMSNLISSAGHTIRTENAFYGASQGGSAAYVSPKDIARVAATVLMDPSSHVSKAYPLDANEA